MFRVIKIDVDGSIIPTTVRSGYGPAAKKLVGGHPAQLVLADDVVLICDEDAPMRQRPENLKACAAIAEMLGPEVTEIPRLFGPVVLAGRSSKSIAHLPENRVAAINEYSTANANVAAVIAATHHRGLHDSSPTAAADPAPIELPPTGNSLTL